MKAYNIIKQTPRETPGEVFCKSREAELFARWSLLFARCLLLFARCSLLFARCSTGNLEGYFFFE